jgi:hypothetical protein
MKIKSRKDKVDNLRPEYDLKLLLKDGVQGKYSRRYREGTNVVLLASDVADVFRTDESVNEALRLVIQLSKVQSKSKNSRRKHKEIVV